MEGVSIEVLSSCFVLPKPNKPRFLGFVSAFPVSCSGCFPVEPVWVGVEDPVEEGCVSRRLLMAGACARLMMADLRGGDELGLVQEQPCTMNFSALFFLDVDPSCQLCSYTQIPVCLKLDQLTFSHFGRAQ